jgi:hypothetical protein
MAVTALAASERTVVPKPLFADPNYHGSCDPEIVWNETAGEWWAFYTARRATQNDTYVGTPIGVAASRDLATWRFAGYVTFDGQPGAPDMPVTFWAPAVIRVGDVWHMFVTYKDNATPPWGGIGVIRHYTAPASDPLHGWKLADVPPFAQPDPIDATILSIDGEFRAYYRVSAGGGVQWSTSRDLVQWEQRGPCPGDVNAPPARRGFDYQEAPYVFRFGSAYWMLTDPHRGLAVYRSDDAVTWKLQGRILEQPGRGARDDTRARHPSVAIVGERAFLIYHVEPNRPYPTPPPEARTTEMKKAWLQLAELKLDGDRLTCDRDAVVTALTSPEPAPR